MDATAPDRTPPDLTGIAAFPPATSERWRTLVEATLKGADFERSLVGRTRDGIRVAPLYEAAGPAPQPGEPRPAPGAWPQRLDHPDPGEANALAHARPRGRRGGARPRPRRRSLRPGFRAAPCGASKTSTGRSPGSSCRSCQSASTRARRAEDAASPARPARRAPGRRPRRARPRPRPRSRRRARARRGARRRWEARAPEILAALDARGFRGLAFRADGRPFHEAGASEAQELAAVLADRRRLPAGAGGGRASAVDGRGPPSASGSSRTRTPFVTVAKFRAFRRLWARVEAACGLEPAPVRLDAETAWRMTTRRDPWVNLLRGTVAAFAAGIGGADAVDGPALHGGARPARRLRAPARPQRAVVLLEEGNLWRVADPARGPAASRP